MAECPGLTATWRNLAELLLEQGRWLELDRVAEHLTEPPGSVEGAVMRARGKLARKEFAAARQLLEESIARSPQEVWPLVILSHLLLQEGKDLAAAERVLRRVLTLDPNHAQARHNLELLLHNQTAQRGQPPAVPAVIATPVVSLPAPTAKPRVSLCLIVRNEEQNLPACLGSVRDLVDEIIVLDTGSTDRTREIALGFGARVFDFAWVDDFSAARNESKRHATGEWIFWLDADERLDEANRRKLRTLFAGLEDENAAYVMKQHSPKGNSSAVRVDHVRLFRNHPQLRWEHRIHEQLLPSLHRLGTRFCWTEIIIDHAGYRDEEHFNAKCERNLAILELEVKEHPDQLLALFYLGVARLEQDRPADAIPLLRRCLEKGQAGDSTARKVHVLLAQCHRRLNQPEEALHVCQAGRKQFPADPELLFVESELRTERGEHAEAEKCLRDLLQSQDAEYFTALDAGLRGYKGRHNLALSLSRQGKHQEAETQWQQVLQECPAFAPAWLALGEMYLTQKRGKDLDQAVTRLAALPGDGPIQADLLRARAYVEERKWEPARRMVKRAISRAPGALMPRVLLCQTLLREGKDWAAAERALRDVLALEPEHLEARHDLELLLQHQRRSLAETADLPVVVAPSRPAGRPRVSLCLIVKNEEKNLPACLSSVTGLVEEVIVVDTGSTDATREVAARFGAKVFDFTWVDSFAAARNESLRHATGEWIFWLDADDRLDEQNRDKLRAFFANLPTEKVVAYVMKCVCLPDPVTGQSTEVDHVRLFRNRPELRWEHRVHEQIMPSIRRLGSEVVLSDVRIQHTGYQDREVRRQKLQRDLRLLKLEEAERPEHPFTLFNLGSVYQEMGQIPEALVCFRRSLERSQPTDSIVRKLYALLAQGHRALGQHQQALDTCQRGLRDCPDDAELLFREGLARIDLGDLVGAAASLERLLQSPPGKYLSSMVPEIRGYLARQNLAEVYRSLGRLNDAEAQWRKVLADKPGYRPALQGLVEVCVRQDRLAEAEKLFKQLDKQPGTKVEDSILQARLHLAQRVYPGTAAPGGDDWRIPQGAGAARVILTHVLLQEGRDWLVAEQALRTVLELDPQNKEASHNLALLLKQHRGNQARE